MAAPTTPEEGAVLATFNAWFNAQDTNVIDSMSRRAVACTAWHDARRTFSRAAPIATPLHQERGAGNASDNIEAIAKVISLSYGENPDDDAPPTKICGPNNEPLPNWQAYEEQAKAVFVWFDAVLSSLHHQERGEVVKLEWVQDTNDNWLASPLGITYLILEWAKRCDLEVSVGGDHYAKIGSFDTLAQAQSAGQDDFNRRLSTLVPSSLLREAQEALKDINRLASPKPERTFDVAIRDLEWIADEARRILARLEAAS